MLDYVIILAAGRGERLWPLTRFRPKPLLPLPGGYSILCRLVVQSAKVSGSIAVVVPEALHNMFREDLKSCIERFNIDVFVETVSQDYRSYGTGYAVKVALEKLGIDRGKVLIINGDLVLRDNVVREVSMCRGNCIAVFRAQNGRRYGVVMLRGDRVARIVEKPGWVGSYLVNAGIYLVEAQLLRETLEDIKPSERGEIELTEALNIIAERYALFVREVKAEDRLEVTHWWDYLIVSRKLLEWEAPPGATRLKSSYTEGIVVRGEVYVSESTNVSSNVVVEGPAWIGNGAEVGPYTHIRPYSVVHKGAKVGSFVQLKASIIMEYAKIPHLNYVGDSVIAPYANMGAGSITANLRFDKAIVKSGSKGPGSPRVETGLQKLGAIVGPYAQIGVNASIMPGSRIGACSWVEPGSVVKGDVPDCSFYRQGGVIVKLEDECCKRLIAQP